MTMHHICLAFLLIVTVCYAKEPSTSSSSSTRIDEIYNLGMPKTLLTISVSFSFINFFQTISIYIHTYIHSYIGLQDYINVINVFFVSTTPVLKAIVNDINSKISEFKAMDGKIIFMQSYIFRVIKKTIAYTFL